MRNGRGGLRLLSRRAELRGRRLLLRSFVHGMLRGWRRLRDLGHGQLRGSGDGLRGVRRRARVQRRRGLRLRPRIVFQRLLRRKHVHRVRGANPRDVRRGRRRLRSVWLRSGLRHDERQLSMQRVVPRLLQRRDLHRLRRASARRGMRFWRPSLRRVRSGPSVHGRLVLVRGQELRGVLQQRHVRDGRE